MTVSDLPVPRVRTIVTIDDLVPAFARAFEAATGERCEVIDAAIIYGKLCAECGHPTPTQACWCWNVGNIRGRSSSGRYCLLGNAYEIVDANRVVPPGWHVVPNTFGAFVPPGRVCVLPDDPRRQEFRAYETIDEACHEYVEVLGRRFGRAWRELAEPGSSPEDFVQALKADRYFTGDAATYTRNVASVARWVLPRVEEILARSMVTNEVSDPNAILLALYRQKPTEIPAAEDFVRTLADTEPPEDPNA